MSKRFFRNYLCISGLLISHLVFSYYFFNGWWYSSIGTVAILFFSFLVWKKDFIDVTGLNLSLKKIIFTIAAAISVTFFSFLLINYIGSKHNISLQFTSIRNYYHDVFYILNEEIVLGALAIYLLINLFKIKPIISSILLALFFAMIHFVFYKWIFLEKGILQSQTLIALFLIGFTRNNIIILSKHIGFSWALHFGWMAVMFGSTPYWIHNNRSLSQPERFNIFIGSNEMLITGIVLAICSGMILRKRSNSLNMLLKNS